MAIYLEPYLCDTTRLLSTTVSTSTTKLEAARQSPRVPNTSTFMNSTSCKPYNRSGSSFRWIILLVLFAACLSFSSSSSPSSSEAIEVEIGTMSADAKIPNTFPELTGMPGEEAKSELEKKYPSLKVFIVPEDSMVTMDYLEDRVRIFVDKDGKVARDPMIG